MKTTKLRESRISAGLNMRQAAEAANTPYRTWQDWELGNRRVPGIAIEWLKLYTQRKENG